MEYPQIIFGTYLLGDNTYKSLNDALINGYRSIDTASLYKCEHLIGKYLKEKTKKSINFFYNIRSCKGIRHKKRYPIRGQRTHTNAKTKKRLKS